MVNKYLLQWKYKISEFITDCSTDKKRGKYENEIKQHSVLIVGQLRCIVLVWLLFALIMSDVMHIDEKADEMKRISKI